MLHKESFMASATIIGFTIGAGILGMPYVIQKSGFFTGFLVLFLIALITLYLNLAVGEVSLRTKGYHQFPVLVKKYLGNNWSKLILADILILGYGAITAYIIGGGRIITDLFGGDLFYNSLLFGIICSIIILMNVNFLEGFESFFVLLLVISLIGMFILSFGHFNISNLSGFSITKSYIPLAVILFSFFGATSIPEVKEELKNMKNMKFAIIFGVILISVIYIFFSALIIGISGSSTTPVATTGASLVLGSGGKLLFSLFAFLALITSFLGMGFVLKDTFRLDMGFSKNLAWFMSIIVPIIIFLSGVVDFISILNVVGVIHAILLTFMIFNLLRVAKIKGDRQPEYSLKQHPFIELVIYLVIILGGIFALFL